MRRDAEGPYLLCSVDNDKYLSKDDDVGLLAGLTAFRDALLIGDHPGLKRMLQPADAGPRFLDALVRNVSRSPPPRARIVRIG